MIIFAAAEIGVEWPPHFGLHLVEVASPGLDNVLPVDLSGAYPASYSECPSGLILIANGHDPMVRWIRRPQGGREAPSQSSPR